MNKDLPELLFVGQVTVPSLDTDSNYYTRYGNIVVVHTDVFGEDGYLSNIEHSVTSIDKVCSRGLTHFLDGNVTDVRNRKDSFIAFRCSWCGKEVIAPITVFEPPVIRRTM